MIKIPFWGLLPSEIYETMLHNHFSFVFAFSFYPYQSVENFMFLKVRVKQEHKNPTFSAMSYLFQVKNDILIAQGVGFHF